MRRPRLARGVYAITPDWADTDRLCDTVSVLLTGRLAALQYRNKAADAARRRIQAARLRDLCAQAGVPFIVNDHLDLALDLDADGVHLGQEDGELAAARAALGPERLLGASCYGSLERAQAAVTAGVDHIALGAVFASGTKPGAPLADHGLFTQAASLGVPRIAIGGIRPDNVAAIWAAGADCVAVISALFDAPEPLTALAALQPPTA
jgi:thiamine-phosphate pyrophosphorylase